MASVPAIDPLDRARAHRRELVQLAEDWLAGKPLDRATLRRVAMRPPDWTHMDQVQREIPFPDAAFPKFTGVLLQAKREVEAEYTPPSIGERPKEPDARVQRLLAVLRAQVDLEMRAKAEALEGLSVKFSSYSFLLQLLQVELSHRKMPLPDSIEAEMHDVIGALKRLLSSDAEATAPSRHD